MPVYQLRVALKEARPLVWRRILVPASVSLGRLHHVLQAAFGWEDAHLHLFHVEGKKFGNEAFRSEDEVAGDVGDESRLTIERATLGGLRVIEYEYDLGTPWELTVRAEKVISAGEAPGRLPACVAGAGAGPPEDVGGAPGYERFLWTLSHPNHKDHGRMLEWAGGSFDPDRFDLAEADRRVRTA